jgi:hypothetical protein
VSPDPLLRMPAATVDATVEQVPGLPVGAIDLHTHTAPSIFPRLLTDEELAREAAAAGMRAVVLKAHEASTVERARAIDGQDPGVRVFGGIVLNHHVGGLDPDTVAMALASGARIVWMPTLSARQHQQFFAGHSTALFGGEPLRDSAPGLHVLDQQGTLLPEVVAIIDLLADRGVILSTGHLAWQEAVVLVEAALAAGVERVLVGHPDMLINHMPLEIQLDLARKGAYLEKCYLACTSDLAGVDLVEMAAGIEYIGAASCVLVTDYGQTHNPSPVVALGQFCRELGQLGISEAEIRRMVVENPAFLLGL